MTYRINGQKVTKEEWDAHTKHRIARGIVTPIQPGDKLCIGAFESFQSPVDGSWISSREQLRDHEKKHNVRQVGNDLLNETKKKKEGFEARKAESKAQDKDFLYTALGNPTKDIGEHYAKPSGD